MKKLISLFLAMLFLLGSFTVVSAEGEAFTGTVINATEATMTVMNEFGTLLTFVPADNVAMPAIGSTVTVGFSGDLTTQLIAEQINVDAEPVLAAANGTVASVAAETFVVTLDNGAAQEYRLSAYTEIAGKAEALEAGQLVAVTYVESAYGPAAVKVEIAEKPVVVQPVEDVTDKTLSGEVTKLTKDKITIKTKKGKTWSFKLAKKTKVSGKYDLEVGSTVTVTYDGYASKVPAAKKIKVTKAATQYKTMSGTVSQYLKNDALLLKDGHYFHIKGAKNTGKGLHEIGTKVTITYYVKNGENYAVKVNWKVSKTGK